jgi:flagellar assembly protein FliH
LLKIVKSKVYSFDSSKLVPVGEPEPKKQEPEKAEEEEEAVRVPTPEEIAAQEEAERKKKLEEETKRFNEAVIKRSDEIVAAKKKKMDEDYERIIAAGKSSADKMIEDAKSKTKTVLEAADEECRRLREKAEKEGFEAGFAAGKEDAVKKCDKYLEAAAALLTVINGKKEAYYISHEYELCETVLDMVRKITMSEIKTDPEVIDRIAANAAKSFRNSDYVKISLAEGEASRKFVTDKEFVRSLIPFIPEIDVEELDPQDAPPGTVVLDNGSEIIDASVPTQLDFLREIMKNSHGEEQEQEQEQ